MFVTPPPKLPKILHHWYRSVSAFPDGALVHDGDCKIYDTFLHLCTCGLLHALNRIDDAKEFYAAVEGETNLHEKACDSVRKKAQRGKG
jgi:hypothetical protein